MARALPTIEIVGRAVDLPRHLADLHRRTTPGQTIAVRLVAVGSEPTVGHHELLLGAGFEPVEDDRGDDDDAVAATVRRLHTLPDWVGPDMTALVIGLNPSPASAEGGVAFARPGNRFWPAALGAGLVSVDRDPVHALVQDGVGFTDLVKRTTRSAAELTAEDYRAGMARLERLAAWLRPERSIVVGLTGWRAARDRHAVAGWQPTGLGGRPVYLMPNTSGLNAHTTLEGFVDHFAAALGANQA